GDINNDGQLDLIGGSSKGLFAWQGSHTGGTLSWSSVSDGLSTSNEYTGVKLGDINNDGRLDIVAGSYSSRGISVYICSTSGSISWTEGNEDTNLKSSGNTFDNYLIDLNQDSKLDLVASIRGGIKVYLGNGNSGSRDTWWKDVSKGLPTSDDYYEIAIDDVNADGKPDICSNFQIWSNSGSMSNPDSYSWSQLELGATLSEPIGTAVGDLNDDDNLDIVGCGWGSGVVAYTLTLGSGSGVVKIKYLLSGVVKDSANGKPIVDVSVKLEPGGYSGKSDGQGTYNIKAPNGTYTLSYSISGYLSDSENVVINGDNVVKDVDMVVGEDPKEDKKEDDSGLPFMELPIVIFTIFIVIIIFKMSNRKK
ncbi:MAG: VCBS repeat-containing protein, partial [Thermoplasmata archaeon]|nr:VCBS repeat-containing protein [Thermoplasmata archaeon]